MTTPTESALLERIQRQLRSLPPEKQREVLNFILALRRGMSTKWPVGSRRLRDHPAFGSWRDRNIDALSYQQNLRTEWDE